MRARVNFGSDGTKHVDILCRWGHNVKLHPDYIQTYNHGEYSVVLPVYGTQYCNVFVFSTKKKEVDSSAPLKKSDFKPFVPARSVERKMENIGFL